VSVQTAYSANSLSGNLAKVNVSAGAPALATAVANGKVLLMGFVGAPKADLDSRSTATVFAFYALNGPFLEPALQTSLIGLLNQDSRVDTLASAISNALKGSAPNISVDNPSIKGAIATMLKGFMAQSSSLRTQGVTISPQYQSSGLFVRETEVLADAVNVYNNFRRPVHVFVDRTDPQPAAVTQFDLDGALVDGSDAAQRLQELAGFAQGDVPRSAVKSQDVLLPAVDGAVTTYTLTVVGAGGDVLAANQTDEKAQKARDLALKTAVERFLAPAINSALEAGARQRTAADITPILQGISNNSLTEIQSGNFTQGLADAFADLFSSSNLSNTVSRVLQVYYPNLHSPDGIDNMRSRLTQNLAPLVGASAGNLNLIGNGILNTIHQAQRIQSFTVVTKPVQLRVTPEQSYLGKGGQALLTAELKLPQGVSANGITYRWSLSGVGAGYATDAGTDRAFPFTTNSTSITYKHRDTLNVLYGTDIITVEALQNQNGTPTVIAKGSASVTIKENTISLTPQTVQLGFGEEQTFTTTVNPSPSTGTLRYVFVTYGPSTFVGGAQTSVGSANSVRFRQADDQVGHVQPVNVTVVLDNAGTQTILGQASASVTVGQKAGYILSGSSDGTGTIGVDDDLDISLNGVQIYSDGAELSGERAPIRFQAQRGDVLTFVVRDTYGRCSGLRKVYLVKGNRSVVADQGFDLGCGRPGGNQGVVHTQTFTIPF
jgi:hypothetical protein